MDINNTILLISFANKLDALGFHKEAGEIDQFIEDSTKRNLDPRYIQIFDSVRGAINSLDLTDQDKLKVLNAIDTLQLQNYKSPNLIPEGASVHYVPKEAIGVAANYAERFQSSQKLEQQMQEALNNNELKVYEQLKHDYNEDMNDLRASWHKLIQYKHSNSKLFNQLIEYIQNALSGQPESLRLLPERRNYETTK